MIPIFTATNLRPEVLSVWCNALRATLRDEYVTHVFYVQPEPPTCGDSCSRVQEFFLASSLVCFESQMPQDGVRVFIEEDIIPVREWSLADYPGDLLMLEGSPGQQWQSLAISRVPAHAHGQPSLIPQRFVRDGGCPAWMPSSLCELALAANAKIVGDHFLHIDKMHNRPPPKEIAEKNKLLSALASMFA